MGKRSPQAGERVTSYRKHVLLDSTCFCTLWPQSLKVQRIDFVDFLFRMQKQALLAL